MSKEYLDAQFNLAPQTYNQYTPLNIDLCTQLGTQSLHQIGYIFCVPNWVHILCTKLGTYFLYPIGCMFCVPNLVPLSMTPLSKAPTYKAQFGVEIVYQIGYSRGCTQLGTVFHIPAIFSRLIGILRPGHVQVKSRSSQYQLHLKSPSLDLELTL